MPDKRTVLLVATDSQSLDLLGERLKCEGFDTLRAACLEEVDRHLKNIHSISIAVIDLSGFPEEIWDRCQQLRDARIPFVLISQKRSPAMQKQSITHGATALLIKPVSVEGILDSIRTSLRE
ncbi:MAG: hypothetical protein IBX68_00035 [Dehalococcoidia bacterium]|nr:hypothetical protein [Dehalococcoidia bacterium]